MIGELLGLIVTSCRIDSRRRIQSLPPARDGEKEEVVDCEKCHEPLQECRDCKGQTVSGIGGGRLTCSTCQSTGWVCVRTHKGHWQR